MHAPLPEGRKSFNPCFDGSEARVPSRPVNWDTGTGFNPCFDGSEARVAARIRWLNMEMCFNPCFDGSEARALGMPKRVA